jgi:hypothetical protein
MADRMIFRTESKIFVTAAACLLLLFVLDAEALAEKNKASSAQLSRAEGILIKLRELEQATTSLDEFQRRAAKFYPSLFSEVAELAEGDLKTDLTTAVFLHEAIYRHWSDDADPVNCKDLPREVYRKICRSGESRRQFQVEKARLHSNWAAAVVRQARGANDQPTLLQISEMRAAREEDIRLASLAISALQEIGERIIAHPSLRAYEESRELACVSYEQFAPELAATLVLVDQILTHLPRGPLHQALRNARNGFREGETWWRRNRRSEEKTVAASDLSAPDFVKLAHLNPDAVAYTVVSNWRKATNSLREAEILIRNVSQTSRLR